MNGKIMTGAQLEDIMYRLNSVKALLYLLYESADSSTISEDAISGVSDLLDHIQKDFQAEIDAAPDYGKEGRGVA